MPSWLKTIQIRKSNQSGRLKRLSRLDLKNLLACTTEDVDSLKSILGKFNGNPRVGTHLVGSNETNNRFDGQQIRHTILPDKSHSTMFVERM